MRFLWALATTCLCLGPAPSATATLLVDEPFAYPDGALEIVAFPVWTNYSGSFFEIAVANGVAILSQTNLAEEALTVLPGGPHTNGVLYASFSINCTALPANGGTYFAQFKGPGSAFRARVFATTNGAPASRWRVGIANAASTATNAAFFATNLTLSSVHRLVVRYNAATGTARLWLDPVTEADPSVQALDGSSAAAAGAFILRQTPSVTNSVGTLQIDDLRIATSFPEVTALWDNRWVMTTDSKWETPTQWSLGTPSGTQTGPLIANAPSKTIIIDAMTALESPSSLIVNNLTVSSPDASITNTLLLDKVGANNPLVVSNVFTLGSGGAFILSDSALHLPGGASQPWGSPGFYVDGPVILSTNASLSASNVSILAGNFSGSSNGAITLDDGSILAGKLVLGNAGGGFGSLTINSGLLTFPGGPNLFIGGAPNAVGALTVNGGLLDAPHSQVFVGAPGSGTLTATGGEIRPSAVLVGESGPGELQVQGGSVEVADYVVVGAGEIGAVSVTGGQLVVTNPVGGITVGGNSEGKLTVSSNGVVVATFLSVATSDLPGRSAYGAIEVQPGGSLTVGADLVVAPTATATGIVSVTGGTLTATNGVVHVGPVGGGHMDISGGSTILRELMLGGSTNGAEGVLHLTGGHLKVLSLLSVNAFDVGGGDLDGSGGTVIVGFDHNAAMTVSGGTATNIGTLLIGYSGGYTGTFTQDGGMVTVLTNVVVGDCVSGAVGNVTLTNNGAFYAMNTDQTGVFDVRNGTVVLEPDARLMVDALVITNACGHFLNNAGNLNLYAGSLVLDPNMDADGDGLPNGWEQAHVLDPLSVLGNEGAPGDPDGDGQSNVAEYLAGTDPWSADSVFRLLSATVTGQDVRLDWTVVGGHSYVVQMATNSTGGISNAFADLSGLISVGGTGESTANYVHAEGTTNPGAYYRVRLGP